MYYYIPVVRNPFSVRAPLYNFKFVSTLVENYCGTAPAYQVTPYSTRSLKDT